MTYQKRIGELITAARQAKGWPNRGEPSRLSGIPVKTWYDYETGNFKKGCFSTVAIICQTVGLDARAIVKLVKKKD